MKRYGCKCGMPHDMVLIRSTDKAIWERCKICNKTFRWPKGRKGRVDNAVYLEAHARNYCQKGGATNRLYMKLYEKEKCVIQL